MRLRVAGFCAALLSTPPCLADGALGLQVGLGRIEGSTVAEPGRVLPSAILWWTPSQRFTLGLGYAYLGNFRSTGFFSSDGLKYEGAVQQFSLIPALNHDFDDTYSGTLGLSLDAFRGNGPWVPQTTSQPGEGGTRFRAGVYADIRARIADPLQLGVFYRYATPPGHGSHTIGVLLRIDF